MIPLGNHVALWDCGTIAKVPMVLPFWHSCYYSRCATRKRARKRGNYLLYFRTNLLHCKWCEWTMMLMLQKLYSGNVSIIDVVHQNCVKTWKIVHIVWKKIICSVLMLCITWELGLTGTNWKCNCQEDKSQQVLVFNDFSLPLDA